MARYGAAVAAFTPDALRLICVALQRRYVSPRGTERRRDAPRRTGSEVKEPLSCTVMELNDDLTFTLYFVRIGAHGVNCERPFTVEACRL